MGASVFGVVSAFAFLCSGSALAQKVGASDIGGVVSGPKGPEAGV